MASHMYLQVIQFQRTCLQPKENRLWSRVILWWLFLTMVLIIYNLNPTAITTTLKNWVREDQRPIQPKMWKITAVHWWTLQNLGNLAGCNLRSLGFRCFYHGIFSWMKVNDNDWHIWMRSDRELFRSMQSLELINVCHCSEMSSRITLPN